jgi:hypothetical protein
MGVIYPSLHYSHLLSNPTGNQVILDITKDQPISYSICGTWLTGERFNRCPTATNWFEKVKAITFQKQAP